MSVKVIEDEEGTGIYAHAECASCGWHGEGRILWGVAKRDADRHTCPELEATTPKHIDESNWGEFAAVILETEATHWLAEYEQLSNRASATKVRAAWKLGATMLAQRAAQYRQQDVEVTKAVSDDSR